MTALASRLARLEGRIGNQRGRIIAVRSYGHASIDEIDTFLVGQGIRYRPDGNDLVVSINYLGAPLPGGIELMNVTPMAR